MLIQLALLLVIIAANLTLGFVAVLRNPQRRTNQLFAWLAAVLSLWMIASYFEDTGLSRQLAAIFLRFDYALALIVAFIFYLFCNNFLDRMIIKSKRFRIFAILSTLIGTLLGWFVVINQASIELSSNGIKFETTAWEYLYDVILIGLFVIGIITLFIRLRETKGVERDQTRIMIFGLSIWISIALLANLVLPTLFGIPRLSRIGLYATIIYVGFTMYAIVRHRLFDFRLILARSFTYVFLLATLGIVYAVLLFGVSRYFFPSAVTDLSQSIVNVALAVILAFTFQPLRRFFEKLTDRIFYRDRYDTQDVLSGIGRILTSELMIEPLLSKTLIAICTSLHIEWGQFIIFNDDKIYRISNHGKLPNKLVVASSLAHLGKTIMVADELEGGVAKEVMDDHSISVSVVLRTKGEFVGYLLLGDKLSGEIYSGQDIALLHILSSQLAIAIENAKAYAEIAQFNETLQERVRQATKRLRVANANLKELDKAKDEFISMASHQLRTPLTAIKGYLSMILEGDMGPVASEQVEFLTYAYDGSERMVTLISDLLNVSRMSAGRFLIERQPTDVVNMVSDEVRQLQSTAKTKNLKLTFTPPTKVLPLVLLDEGKTRQVIMNFIDNALYYTREGGVTVSLDVRDKAFELRVKDSGIGVPVEARSKLFTKFFRAENAQTVRPDGTGLGLYLAKRVVEDQGGQIIFETEMGKGSTFGFRLPILAAAPPGPGK